MVNLYGGSRNEADHVPAQYILITTVAQVVMHNYV